MRRLFMGLALVALAANGVQRMCAQITLDGSNHCASAGHQITSVSCTLSNVTAGDLITVEFGDRDGYETSISDNSNGAYTRIYYVPDSTDPNYSGMAYFMNSASGSVTVQVSLSGTDWWAVVSVQAWKGAATSSVLDTGAITQHLTSTSGSVANANCGAAQTPGGAGELVISYMVGDFDTSVSPGANYNLIDLPNSSDNPAFPEYSIQTTAQATNGSFTSAADDWTVGCAAFKPASSLPTPTLTVTGQPNPSTSGQAVTLTATISSGPTGTITFYDDGSSIGTGSINGTIATMTTNSLAVGSHSIMASWPGNSSYNPVTSSPVTQTVSSVTPTLILSSSANPSQVGAVVTFTATISNGLAGTITFYDGGSSIGTGSISGSTATFTASSLAAGSHTITASWPGNGNYGAVTSSPITQTVNLLTPTLTLSSSLNPSPLGAGVTLAATISNGLTGTVTFYNGGTSIGTGSISDTTATFTTSSLPAGNDAITASWPGNGNFGPVTSSPLTQTVHQPVTGQSIYSYAAAYDGVGNVIGYTDSVMGTMNFTYDTLNRLATANGNEPSNPYPNYCWNYDNFGNRTTQMSASVAFPVTMGGPTANACQTTGSLGPVVQAQYSGTVNGANNNQMSSTSANSNQGQGYDAAGNVNNDGARQYLYDGEGRICEVLNTLVGVTIAYIYDADGRRVAKGSANWGSCDPSANGFQASTDYVLGPAGEQVTEVTVNNGVATGVAHTNAWAGGMLLATYDVNSLHFYLTDPLGTRRVQTDYAGVEEQTCQSLPFGDGETCSPSPTEHLFTGKERDTESGNDYFGARYNSSAMGRFLSPDWSEEPDTVPYAEFENPQTLNLYAYGHNNPLLYNDPDGHDVQVCDNNGHCSAPISDDAYKAAQQASNGSLNGPSLAALQNSASGTGTLTSTSTDANGNTTTTAVGTVKWTADNPGIQGPAAMAGFNQLGNTSRVVTAGTAIYAGVYAAAALGPAGVEAAIGIATRLRAGMVIGGFVMSAHAVEQAEERGVTVSEIEDAVGGVAKSNPLNGWDSVQRFYTSSCEVRVNKITGVIITVISKISR